MSSIFLFPVLTKFSTTYKVVKVLFSNCLPIPTISSLTVLCRTEVKEPVRQNDPLTPDGRKGKTSAPLQASAAPQYGYEDNTLMV